jgi:hypothetical protein
VSRAEPDVQPLGGRLGRGLRSRILFAKAQGGGDVQGTDERRVEGRQKAKKKKKRSSKNEKGVKGRVDRLCLGATCVWSHITWA